MKLNQWYNLKGEEVETPKSTTKSHPKTMLEILELRDKTLDKLYLISKDGLIELNGSNIKPIVKSKKS